MNKYMNKAIMTLTILGVLVIIMPLSAWADFVDFLCCPAALHRSTGAGTLIMNRNIRENPVHIDSNYIDNNHFEDTGTSKNITGGISPNTSESHSCPNTRGIIASNSNDTGKTKIYFTPFTEFTMVKTVLEPGTMLFLGIFLLSLGLFAIKFRK